MCEREDTGKLITTEIKTNKYPNCIFSVCTLTLSHFDLFLYRNCVYFLFQPASEWVSVECDGSVRVSGIVCEMAISFVHVSIVPLLFACLFQIFFSLQFVRKVYFYVAQWGSRVLWLLCVVAFDHLKRPVVCWETVRASSRTVCNEWNQRLELNSPFKIRAVRLIVDKFNRWTHFFTQFLLGDKPFCMCRTTRSRNFYDWFARTC